MASNTYERLMEPGLIGAVRTRNRLIKTGSTIGFFPWDEGKIQQEVLDIYDTIAKGGAGLVTIGGAPLGVPGGRGFAIDDDKYLPSMSRLAEVIRKNDCPAFVQLFHVGPMMPAERAEAGGFEPVAASHLDKSEMHIPGFAEARELTVDEIKGIVRDFALLAERTKKAGFQGIELNAACDHLLNSFLSPAWNKRRDEYGCDSLDNRARIVVEIIQQTKELAGKDFAVIALINGAEPGLEGGLRPAEATAIAKILEDAGADAIHVRAEMYSRPKNPAYRDSTQFPDIALYPETPYPLRGEVDDSRHGKGGWMPLAAAVKKGVPVPVIASGRLDIDLGEDALQSGKADFISFNRRLMADPELPRKVAEGRIDDIRPCTGCITCFDNNEKGNPATCQVNAALGKERQYEIKPAEKKKRVMIVGSGPAGMETARIAAMRGHEVMLYEKSHWLGGSIVLAAMVKGFHREDFLGLVRYLTTQVKKLGVQIHTGTEVTKELVAKVKPDALVIAAGATHDVPEIPGIDKRNVVTSKALHGQLKTYVRFFPPKVLRALTRVWMPIGKRVVIMGGNIQGCQTAEFLVKRGKKVTIVSTAEQIGDGLLEAFIKARLLDWMDKKGVAMYAGATYDEITDKGLVITTREGRKITIEADTVLTALPLLPNPGIVAALKDGAPEIYTIGDAGEARLTVDAIADGSRVGRLI
ncbi:MAG: FAD-dependent oxidoreductase [Thermoleophilia bacterium]|nr:FAD-dependent oxidoreductase [Thermoleophilia bacterium]